ncbi:metallophosphoesterase family protein [Dyadobacter psychrophilus]|uniref:Calcineurin-like phosphoesterase n=1 Tax=Dyadobacter psychrophilus TaxID=651661 RepID=A0A1T5DE03_9BACT|nr:metallophosphoesterase [Dyadobacter psychrophilus]SKB69925.1 Calcineurin-like phosphoesterase [Dyadobacter psychrophilus]
MKPYQFIALIFFILAFVSCKGLFEYSPSQITLNENEKGLTAKNIDRIQKSAANDTVKFIVAGDTHQWLDETRDFVKSANAQTGISFVTHLGDVSASGITQEFKWFNEIMADLKYPYLTVAGDLEANDKAKLYQHMFGEINYSFEFAGSKFVFVNTNSKSFDSNGVVPDVPWLKAQLSTGASSNNTIVLGHTPPFSADFDDNLETQYAKTLADNPNVKLSFYGHEHAFSENEPYQDGIKYYVTAGMKARSYLIVTIWKTGYRVTSMKF